MAGATKSSSLSPWLNKPSRPSGGDGSCSGDVCRIISAVAEPLWDKEEADIDRTNFLSRHVDVLENQGPRDEVLTPDGVVALIEVFFV
jgi:hypothetical protein